MKRTIFTLSAIFIFTTFISAQAYEGTVEYDKKKQTAFIVEYPYSPEAVENAFVKKMEALGYKPKEEKGLFNKDKGFMVFKSAFISDITAGAMDYIMKVEKKSRKEKDESILYLIINGKDGVNASSTFDGESMGLAKSFLNNLLPNVEAANLELQIKDQEDVVTKAEKKFRKLQDDKDDLEKKLKKLQDDIANNVRDQENTTKEIENQKLALQGLRDKRKPVN